MTRTLNILDIGEIEIPECAVTIRGTFARPASFTVVVNDVQIQVTITRDDTAKTVEDKIKRAVAEALNR